MVAHAYLGAPRQTITEKTNCKRMISKNKLREPQANEFSKKRRGSGTPVH